MKTFIFLPAILVLLLLSNCNSPAKKSAKDKKAVIVRIKPAKEILYHFESGKQWSKAHKADNSFQRIARATNRADFEILKTMDSIIVPNDSTADLAFFLPFPISVPFLTTVDKIIFFSYATQSFAAYENGELVYTGATSMGRKNDQTPTGLFYTNWKAEKTTSTFNDEWDLRWNFNIENKLGVGFHQYALPGYPASHSCLRLQEADAKDLYAWADQWILKKDTVEIKGTPVLVFGSYKFDQPKPWLQLIQNPHALDISDKDIEAVTSPYLAAIMLQQEKRRIQQNNVAAK
jgi:lipoprotein-anchoring transpeptidase ErfK/SrfK